MKLPKYINCENREIEVCDYFFSELCKETCAYDRDIRGINQIGIGAVAEEGLYKRLMEEL